MVDDAPFDRESSLWGTFKWPLRIASMDGQRAQEIEATVDTGASFTTLPSNLLRELGIEATGKRFFITCAQTFVRRFLLAIRPRAHAGRDGCRR